MDDSAGVSRPAVHAFLGNSRYSEDCMRYSGFRLVLALLVGAAPAAICSAVGVDFARDIQPILADKCYHCHGPDANHRKGDLRFDTLDPKLGPFAPRDGYSIVVPKNLDDSVMVMRITSDDPDVQMPPPSSNRTLTKAQIDLLQQWVKEGAKWGKHWSLEVPKRPELPAVKDTKWSRNPIDRFILAKLESEGLKPSPEATTAQLIRRVTLDLTGLPPTPQEVEAFLADQSPDAYGKVADRLFASPRNGENMVWEWLDAARYADTNGYQADPTRTSWPWRDWVIKAMNENLPFDQFGTWQIAGDLIPNATKEQQLASGFNRNHTFNGEGGRIPEETRVENVLDRVDPTATTFMGLTVGCAKCHDHKYDPISQKEYYSLYAYFNQCSETGAFDYVNGGNVRPVMTVASAEQLQKYGELTLAAKDAEEHLAKQTPKIDKAQKQWEQSALADNGWQILAPTSLKSTAGATMQIQPDLSVLVSGTDPETDVHEVVLRTNLPKVTGIRLEPLQDASLPQKGPGRFTESGNFVLTNIEATGVSIADPKQTKTLSFASADATYNQDQWHVNGAIDKDPKTGWGVWKAPDPAHLSAIFRLAEPAQFTGGMEIRLRFHYESEVKHHTMGRFRLALTDGPGLTPEAFAALTIAPKKRSDAEKTAIREFYRNRISPDYPQLNNAIASTKKAAADFETTFTKTMVMDDATPRETHVLQKGAYDKLLDKVDMAVPAVLNPMPTDAPKNRLGLAKWMFDPANPLVARVIVNRYWQTFFGYGIVKTVEDFGVQGERPVNPELLDWLAVEFRDGGWNVKAMQRLMVTSSAYRQSSKVTPELFEKDPENRLLARGPRFRLPSVVLRDQALAASGLLVEKVGGPPVKTYQPPGIWEEATFGQIKYEQDHGDALYRRGVYMFWRRIVGPTEFFDTQSRTTCVVRPSRTNTPLHALTTLNDTTFVEAARALAQRAMATSESPAERINAIYRFVLARAPEAKEQQVFLKAIERLKQQYAADPDAAKKLLAIGESKRNEKLNPVDEAAYTGVCLAVLNLDETMTKE
jgi:hypothetical protein